LLDYNLNGIGMDVILKVGQTDLVVFKSEIVTQAPIVIPAKAGIQGLQRTTYLEVTGFPPSRE